MSPTNRRWRSNQPNDREQFLSQQPLAYAAWSRMMKISVGCFLGLVALVMVSGGSPVYADALEAETSALSVLAPDAGADGVESSDNAHCVLYSNGADNCIVNVQPETIDQSSTAVSDIEPSSTEEAPAIRFFDAIPVAVVQVVTIAAPGLDTGDCEQASSAQPTPVPASEPILDRDTATTTGGLVAPAGQSADAIVVAIVQSATIAAPGQSESGDEELPSAELQLAPTAPLSILEANTTAHNNVE